MTLICSEEKPDLAAHVAAPILKQCGEISLLVNSVLAMVVLIYWHSIAEKRALILSPELSDYGVWRGRHVAPFPIQFLHKCYESCQIILVTSGTAWGKGSIHGTQGVVCQGSQ